MGAALNLHPLAVLVLTIGAGCIFGMLGLVLAAPIASAVVHIMRRPGAGARLGHASPKEARRTESPPEAPTVPA